MKPPQFAIALAVAACRTAVILLAIAAVFTILIELGVVAP